MKKRFFALASLSFLALCTTGCNNNQTRDYVSFYVWGDASEIANYEKIASDFKKDTGINVKVAASVGTYYDNLNIFLGSKNSAPDIFFTESGEFASHISSRKLLNLQPYIDNGTLDIKNESNTDGEITLWDINSAYKYDGQEYGKGDYYAIIKDWSPDFAVWYNKSHFDEYNEKNGFKKGDEGFLEYPSETIPLTWSEFVDLSYKLKGDRTYGTMLDRVPYKHLMEFIQMTGSSTWVDGKSFNYQDKGVRSAFEFFSSLMMGDKKSAPTLGPTAKSSGDAFKNGELTFCFYGNWAYSNYNLDTTSFEFGLTPPPVPDKEVEVSEEDTYATSCGMIGLAVYKNSPVKEDAVKFLNYYMTKGQEYMAKKSFNIPGNKAIAESPLFLQNEDSKLNYINNFFMNLATKYTHEIEYNKYISQATFENIVGIYYNPYLENPSGKTLDSVLKNIHDDLEREF
ncbi:MAG: extracellular solute-binding protein [Candidatus Onthovivens sp.]|nr:extracellular solute-binding protein [Candidatus Onthovivens sp.]